MKIPTWAAAQRRLIGAIAHAGEAYLDHYTRADGTYIWRDEWPGMDGSDDAYETFQGMPLLYALGGPDWLLHRAHHQWEATTWQFTRYGQVEREFDGYYDWMHHGEGSEMLYYLGLADPASLAQRDRAVRFAAMFIGEDPDAPNWDAEHTMLRSPLTGSRGPRFTVTREDWSTQRWIYDGYPPPYDDIPGVDAASETCQWTDDRIYDDVLSRVNARMTRGDVPLNLTSTSLVTHAYLWTGAGKYRQWVLDYLDVWAQRIAANGGICPDNVGPNGIVGELNDGRWWGGYYGWWWPRGGVRVVEALTIAGCNAVLLDGDLTHLDAARSQIDLLLAHSEADGDRRLLPARHGAQGWFEYDPERTLIVASYAATLWEVSHSAEDLERVQRLVGRTIAVRPESRIKKTLVGNRIPFLRHVIGENSDYVEQLLSVMGEAQIAAVLTRTEDDDRDPAVMEVDEWHDRSPFQQCEALVQMELGGAGNQYQGGLLHVPVRHFDDDRRRVGLPDDVAVCVESQSADSLEFRAVNLGDTARRMTSQAGGFGEHRFVDPSVDVETDAGTTARRIGDPGAPMRYLSVELPPHSVTSVRTGLRRHCATPSYETPWLAAAGYPAPVEPRVLP